MTGTQLRNGSEPHEGVYGFSVQSAAGKTVLELVSAGKLPHRKIGVTTAGQIRSLGFDVVPTQGKGFHATVVVPGDWTDAMAEALAAAFVLQPNPLRP